jgi:hypothetical protein
MARWCWRRKASAEHRAYAPVCDIAGYRREGYNPAGALSERSVDFKRLVDVRVHGSEALMQHQGSIAKLAD